MASLRLKELIQQVKQELLDTQREDEGKPGMLRLHTLELEAVVVIEDTGKGGFDLKVVKAGMENSTSQTHKVTMTFELVTRSAQVPPLNAPAGGAGRIFVRGREIGGVHFPSRQDFPGLPHSNPGDPSDPPITPGGPIFKGLDPDDP